MPTLVPQYNYSNNCQTTLAAPHVSGSGTLVVASTTTFPAAPFRLTVFQSDDVTNTIFGVTNVVGSTLTVSPIEGSTDRAFASGCSVYGEVSAGTLNDLWTGINTAATSSSGPQGPIGPQGSNGPQGSAGTNGPQGVSGPQGATGSQGVNGTGSQGVAGPQGSSGAQGATGTGSQGATGAQGVPGVQGNVGPQGATGAGTQGVAGPQGSVGAQGATGAGTQGVAGPQGTPGTQGSTGPQGTPGAQGVPGSQGATGATGPQAAGSVTSVSASSFSGITANVTNPTTTPAIALTTTLSGIVKGTGSALVVATAGTDFIAPANSTKGEILVSDGSNLVPIFDRPGRAPDQLSGLQCYYNWSSVAPVADGATCPVPTDLSGNGVTLTRFGSPTYFRRGLGGRPCFRSSGSNKAFYETTTSTTNGSWSAFAVISARDTGGGTTIFSLGKTSSYVQIILNAGTLNYVKPSGGTTSFSSSPDATAYDNQPTVVVVTSNGTTVRANVNGKISTIAYSDSGTWTATGLGFLINTDATANYDGLVGCGGKYSRALTTTEQDDLALWLCDYYRTGLTTNSKKIKHINVSNSIGAGVGSNGVDRQYFGRFCRNIGLNVEEWYNYSISGTTSGTLNSSYAANITPLIDTYNETWVHLFEFTNDTSTTNAASLITTAVTASVPNGPRVMVMSPLSRTASDANSYAMGAYLRSPTTGAITLGARGFCDANADYLLGRGNSYANTQYFGDGIHPTDGGADRLAWLLEGSWRAAAMPTSGPFWFTFTTGDQSSPNYCAGPASTLTVAKTVTLKKNANPTYATTNGTYLIHLQAMARRLDTVGSYATFNKWYFLTVASGVGTVTAATAPPAMTNYQAGFTTADVSVTARSISSGNFFYSGFDVNCTGESGAIIGWDFTCNVTGGLQ